MWDKNYIFQDDVGMWALKTFVLKVTPPFVLELFKSDYLERRYGTKTTYFKITQGVGSQKIHPKNDPPFLLQVVKFEYLERRYWAKPDFLYHYLWSTIIDYMYLISFILQWFT